MEKLVERRCSRISEDKPHSLPGGPPQRGCPACPGQAKALTGPKRPGAHSTGVLLILKQKDVQSANVSPLALPPSPWQLALSALGLRATSSVPASGSTAAPCPQPGSPCPNSGTSPPPCTPCPPGTTKTRPLGLPTLRGKGQQGNHSTADAFIGKAYNQASRGRALAEWAAFFPLSLAVFKEQEGGGRANPARVTPPAANVY